MVETYHEDLTTQSQVSSPVFLNLSKDLAKCFSRVNRVFDFNGPPGIEKSYILDFDRRCIPRLPFGRRNVPPRHNHQAPGVISGLPEPVKRSCEVFQPRELRLRLLWAPWDTKSLIFSIWTGVVFLDLLLMVETYLEGLTTQLQVSSSVFFKPSKVLAKCFSCANRVFDFYRPSGIEKVLYSLF